eukprot:4317046-Amphidinium_carterae.1
MDLEEGDHNLVVLYIEGSGEAGITFKYSGPDTDGVTVIVPCSVLVLPEGAERPLKATRTECFGATLDLAIGSGLTDDHQQQQEQEQREIQEQEHATTAATTAMATTTPTTQ